MIKIKINEMWKEEEKPTIEKMKVKYKKDADIVILNGFTIDEDKALEELDKLILIRRGETYSREELETLLVSRHTPGVHEKLKKASITVCGAGGLGSNLGTSIARLGISKIRLIDFDVVEPSNLNRQQYFIDDIGEYKVNALKRIIERINPFIEVEAIIKKIDANNIEELLGNEEIIVEAFDNPKFKVLLTNYILKRGYGKLVAGSGMAGFYSSNMIKTKKLMGRIYICGDLEKEAKEGEGLMAPRVSICANHMANMVLRIILGEEEV